MPKTLAVEPGQLRQRGSVQFPEIPIHAYTRPLADERQARGDVALVAALRHMMIVREFETMLASFKATGAYGDIKYNYKGPAHLSVGQEAAAVGAAMALSPDDHIYGSHRSHGEFIAKGLAAIGKLTPDALAAVMEGHADGALLTTVRRHLPATDPTAEGEHFLLFGLLSEIFMRASGFNGGMGGSMHAFFPPFGAYPNNAIVGASAGIATGAALRKKLAGSDGITVSMTGDGATGCGPVWEAMNFAAMAQYDRLWDDAYKGGLPVLFFVNNNFYAMGGQTMGETMGWDRLSRIGAGINAAAMHAETVDGTNPLAVADAVARKRALLRDGHGPALLDVECYRFSGHSSSDANAYRTKDEIVAWEGCDPIRGYGARLESAGIIGGDAIATMDAEVKAMVGQVTAAVVDETIAPPVDIGTDPTLIGGMMFSNAEIDVPDGEPETLIPIEKAIRVRQNAKKARFGLTPEGGALSPLRAITLRDGLFEAILHHMTRDDRLVAYGEECREWGGAFGVYRGLSDLFPHHRLFNAPISEAAIVATAVGYALEGGRALIELMYGDFIGRAGDEIFNQMAKWQAMSAGSLKLPVVLRCSVGSKYGAQHSQDWSALVAHIPGLKVVYPATPFDAKGLMAAALSNEDPVVFFESQRLYDAVEQFQPDGVPADYYRVPIGEPDVKRAGSDLTILTIGPSLYSALAAADALSESHGLSAEVLDARTLVPFNYEPAVASVKKTGRLLVVSEAAERGSFAMTLSATVTQLAFDDLKVAPRVLGTPNWIVPGADMEATYFPQVEDIVDVVTGELFPERRSNRQGIRNRDTLDLARRGI